MSEKNVVDLVADKVLERLGPEFAQAVGPLVDQARAQVEAQMRGILDDVTERANAEAAQAIREAATAVQGAVPAKIDAKDRALRTTMQGGAATVIVAVLTALATLFSDGTIDLFTSEGWKVVLGTASGAAIMAALSYVQRITSPPKE